MRHGLTLALALSGLLTSGCAPSARDQPLRIEGNRLTVDNRTAQEWRRVEVWVNTYYRVTTPSIAAGARFESPLDACVAGFGQRFNVRSTQVRDLRLTATLPDGAPLELKMAFETDRLSDALKGVGGTR